MTTLEQALLATIEAARERLTALTRELVAIPTVNPYSGDDSAGCEAAGQEWIEARFRAMGASVRRVPVPPDVYARIDMIGPAGRSWKNRENVVAEWTLGRGGPAILLNNHMDTVGTANMTIPPFEGAVRDGRLHGRGASDTKGNTVMGLIALEALLQHARGLNGTIRFECVVDEECNGAGAGTIACCLAGVKGDVALCLDGRCGSLDIACLGIATARILAFGHAGHSSSGKTVSAIDKAIRVKQAIDAFGAAYVAAHPECQTTVGVFRSGTLPSIVPGEAEIQINLNYHPDEVVQAQAQRGRHDGVLFRERFEAAIAALAREDAWFAEHPCAIEWIKDMYPFRTDAEDPFLTTALQASRECFTEKYAAGLLPAWFDGAHLSRLLNVPVIGMGCGTAGQAHTSAEHVVLDDLVRGAKALALTIARMMGRAERGMGSAERGVRNSE